MRPPDQAQRQDFKDQPFLVERHAPTADGSIDTLAINCTMAAMFDFREGAEVIEDRALDGLLAAAEQALDAPPAVRDRYRETARLWLDHFEPDGALRRHPDLRNLAERSSNG